MNENQSLYPMDQPYPIWMLVLMLLFSVGLLPLLVFPLAGDWGWLAGWLFCGSLMLVLTVYFLVLNQTNPRVLRNRAKTKKEALNKPGGEASASDRIILPLLAASFFLSVLIPALGHRLGWYQLPLWICIAATLLMTLGVMVMMTAMQQNAHASKVLDIRAGQQLIDTGLYGLVRHPLYTGGFLMMACTPLALGSLWGLIPGLLAAAMLVVRIPFEEEMLRKGLPGYEDYCERVKYKIIPGIF